MCPVGESVLGIRGGTTANRVCLPPLGHSSGETIYTSDTTHGRVADRIVPERSCRLSYSRRVGGLTLVGGLADRLFDRWRINGVAYATGVFHSSLSLSLIPRVKLEEPHTACDRPTNRKDRVGLHFLSWSGSRIYGSSLFPS